MNNLESVLFFCRRTPYCNVLYIELAPLNIPFAFIFSKQPIILDAYFLRKCHCTTLHIAFFKNLLKESVFNY